jgi:hypothetical protein
MFIRVVNDLRQSTFKSRKVVCFRHDKKLNIILKNRFKVVFFNSKITYFLNLDVIHFFKT